MHELERRSGVGRETIRYYIRLGLLPEPTRPKPNVAAYGEVHVERLKTIKRLQTERYLPLAFIKTLLDRPAHGEASMIPGLDLALADGLGIARTGPGVDIAAASQASGLPVNEIETLARHGVVCPRGGLYSVTDLAVLRAWGQVRRSGFSDELGFFAEDAAIYAQSLAPLAAREVDRFLTRLSGTLPAEAAARLAQAGIAQINEMISAMRTNYILRRFEEAARPSDPPPAPDPTPPEV